MNTRKEITIVLLLAGIFFLLGIFRLNDLSLYTDCTRYLIWGSSVAQGNGFVDATQPQPHYYIVNAPLYAIVLAPVLFFFPLSLIAAKIWTLFLGTCALLLFYRWIRFHLSPFPAFCAALFFALNPFMLVLSTEVLSETSFLCCVFSVFILMERQQIHQKTRRNIAVVIVLLSVVTLLREAGAALVLAVILFLVLQKQWKQTIITVGSAALMFLLWTYRNLEIFGAPKDSQSPNLAYIFQHFVTPPDASLFRELMQRVSINFESYATGLKGMLFYYIPHTLILQPSSLFQGMESILSSFQYGIMLFFIPLFLFGIRNDFTQSKIALLKILFLGIYLCIVFIYPVQDIRFLLPLLPLVLSYIYGAISAVYKRYYSVSRVRSLLSLGLFFIFLFPNILCLIEIIRTNTNYRSGSILLHAGIHPSNNYFSTPWSEMGKWIDRETPDDAIIATPHKEIVPFAPKQKFLEISSSTPLVQFETLLRNNAAGYLLTTIVFDSIMKYQAAMDESSRFRFERIAAIGHLYLFRIESTLERPSSFSGQIQHPVDRHSSLGLFRFGRACLKNGFFVDARTAFTTLLNRFPFSAEIKYQLLLLSTFELDSMRGTSALQSLYASPLSTAYIQPAQIHLRAMNSRIQVDAITDPTLQAERLFSIGQLYWNLGYPVQSQSLLQQSIERDTSFFAGYLWAWHYGIQIGDTVRTEEYIRKLKQIDVRNPLIPLVEKITQDQKRIRRLSDAQELSAIHLLLSHEYDAIGLPEEALDEAQRAIGKDPFHAEARRFLSELFIKYNHPVAARRLLSTAAPPDPARVH